MAIRSIPILTFNMHPGLIPSERFECRSVDGHTVDPSDRPSTRWTRLGEIRENRKLD